MLRPTDAALRRLPKAELHVHLDGSLRPSTLAELARERERSLPVYDELALGAHMLVSDARNLEEYLARFALTLSVMQDADALERITFELVEDHAAENVAYVEIRFCPGLNTEGGLTPDEVMDAVLAGAEAGQAATGTRARIIVCALRSLPPASSVEMAEVAAAYVGRGVCAFDLAGAEKGFPARDHLEAFTVARRAGLPVTVHAGEGYGAPSLRQAVEDVGAERIGHGTRLIEDPELMAVVRDRGILLETCLTSNVQTRVAASYADHPVRRYVEGGIAVTLCTDNRLMSGVTLTEEYVHARDASGLDTATLTALARAGFEHAFVSDGERDALLGAFDQAVAGWDPTAG